ncbi:hypothetical protein BHE74_00055606, partial [Ensete ventricosum]
SEMPMSLSCYWRCCPCWGYERRLGLRAWLLSELWDVGDDCLEHSRYGLDLVGESLKSLRSYHQTPRLSGGRVSPGSLNKRQYRPGVWEGGFPSPNKGLPPKSVASWKGCLPRGCRVLSVLATSGPHSSAKNVTG